MRDCSIKMEIKQNHIAYLSHLRAVGCIAVIILHTFYAASAYAADTVNYTVAITARNLMMWAVPVFVMVSGVLLLDAKRDISYAKLFKKYLLRMVLALLLFSELFAVYDGLAEKNFSFRTLLTGLQQALTNGSWNHMWYLYLMIAIYLLLPFYRKISISLKKQDARYLLSVYFVFLALLPMLQTLTGTGIAFYICVSTIYPLYFFLGYSIVQHHLTLPRWLWGVLAGVGTLCMGFLTAGSIYFGWEKVESLLRSYAFPVTILQAAGLFGWFYAEKGRIPHWLDLVLHQIDRCSFGIYLLHMLFLKLVLVTFQWNPYAHGGILAVLGLTIAIGVVTFFCVWGLKKIPGICKLL